MTEIDTTQVYKKLKKQNGEAFARVIRNAVLLDVPNIVLLYLKLNSLCFLCTGYIYIEKSLFL